MEPPVRVESLPAPARRAVDPASPAPMRQMAARGLLPGLKPSEAVTVVALLAESDDAAIATTARTTLESLPAPLLNGALAGDLPPGVLAALVPHYARNVEVLQRLLGHAAMPGDAVAALAATASEAVAELIATNEQRLLGCPAIIEKLYMNKSTRMSTADRVLELAVRNGVELPGIPAYREAAFAIGQELVSEASEEPTPDDLLFREADAAASEAPVDATIEDTHRLDETTGTEVVEERFMSLHAKIASMTISQKIRRAMVGTATERLILVRDTNRLVAQASIKSPSIQEPEVVRIAASRQVSEDVLRIIAMDREWTRSHQVKLNLVQNPRTPLAFVAKLIPYLREHELKQISRSKNVSGAVSNAARQQLSKRTNK